VWFGLVIFQADSKDCFSPISGILLMHIGMIYNPQFLLSF
jgi:hypothetical protein